MPAKILHIVIAVLLIVTASGLFIFGYITKEQTWLWAGVIALLYTKGARSLLLFKRGKPAEALAMSTRESYVLMAAYFVPSMFFLLSTATGEGNAGILAAPIVLSFALAFGFAAKRNRNAIAQR